MSIKCSPWKCLERNLGHAGSHQREVWSLGTVVLPKTDYEGQRKREEKSETAIGGKYEWLRCPAKVCRDVKKSHQDIQLSVIGDWQNRSCRSAVKLCENWKKHVWDLYMSICFRLEATSSVSMVNFIAKPMGVFPVNAFFLFKIYSFGVVCGVSFNFGTITKRTKIY